MTNWTNKLEVSDLWDTYSTGETDIFAVAIGVADRLDALHLKSATHSQQWAITDIAEEFRGFAEGGNADVNLFDSILESLYDIADEPVPFGKLLWVSTFKGIK